MRISLLPKMAFPDSLPSFYDRESATVLEATSKMIPKINELIEDYNKFADEANAKIQSFTIETEEDLETFKMALRQEFQDFIDAIDVKMDLTALSIDIAEERIAEIEEAINAEIGGEE